MAQQPNIEVTLDELPRPTAHPDAPRRWSPHRPGELTSPEQVPWGGPYGTPGPDTGYVYRLIDADSLELAPGERRRDVAAALAILASARASHFGRAPTIHDVAVAKAVLGFSDDVDVRTRERLAESRSIRLGGIASHPARVGELLVSVDLDVLLAPPAEIKDLLEGGAVPFPGAS